MRSLQERLTFREMSETTNEDSGAGRSVEGNSNGQRSPSEAALAEWRSSDQVESGTPSRTSRPYWDIDDYGMCSCMLISLS